MENSSKYSERENFKGKSEIFRIYYDPSKISFDLFLWIENYAIYTAAMNRWTIFKAIPFKSIGPQLICKN